MSSQSTSSDFVLFPTNGAYNATSRSKMMTLDSTKRNKEEGFQYTHSMDPNMVDVFPYATEMPPHSQSHLHPGYSQMSSTYYETTSGFMDPIYNQTSNHISSMPTTPPLIATTNPTDYTISTGSAASGPSIASAPSSALGSPYPGHLHAIPDQWLNTNHGLGIPAVVMNDHFAQDYGQMGGQFDMEGFYQEKMSEPFVDPSLIHTVQPVPTGPGFPPTLAFPDQGLYDYSAPPMDYLPLSSATSPVSYSDHLEPQQASPLMVAGSAHSQQQSPVMQRRASIVSIQSSHSQRSPALSSTEGDEEINQKGRCPFPDCGRAFRDLKAHMLTHQSERPEKCPIATCEYHTKGFARKYDKNRHTLTHYKGTMVCGFCPGSGSPAEKSFNRADVFKRHLTSVHGVEQTPPNCRKRTPSGSTSRGSNSGSDATGKCSTCSATFNNAQDFYEHLDDCVLRVVQQEEPSEAINQQRLAEVAADEEVQKTMEKHRLRSETGSVEPVNELDAQEDEESLSWQTGHGALKVQKKNDASSSSRVIIGTGNAVAKSTAKSANKTGTRAVFNRRRNNRGNYPQSWGCPSSSIKTKKRVLCVFDGQRRLWKDEMMLNQEFEVRLRLPDTTWDGSYRDAYVTDLDVETMKRVEGVLSANEEERGPWSGSPDSQIMGQPAMLLPELCQSQDDEISLHELMS
ncbi:Zinc finger C2H2 type domain-containing protein [Penicillium ucsense]|uniref:Zinc finger C2H2 type domain-containing protein n=1 Tax=Penicillium ucsense TaxID=2839758 RepID=A0A8J8W3P1_9EURO|nr:Zinc finger C2H2 type domain-containing protein [Penicillium ucsense]KAF7736576.1 Zinc finger C2H2 type domain-containing protein [Penicillium ucsense]